MSSKADSWFVQGSPGSPHLPSIISSDGVRWLDYRKTLEPRYGIVWRDIGICYLFMALGAGTPLLLSWWSASAAYLSALPAGIWIGAWAHALFLFGHEAAHGNLAPGRRRNDRLGDWFVWIFFGSNTAEYRRTHMTHHAHLGDHKDTESTYHLCLSVLTIMKSLTGIRVLEVLIRQRHQKRGRRAPAASSRRATPSRQAALTSLRSVAVHLAIVAVLLAGGRHAAVLAWAFGLLCVFPLCATVRTIVEHRHLDAACSRDFSVEVHGPVNRMFGSDLPSRIFGAAGFNQHLLHHWDPAISYTRFRDMARYMERTPLAEVMAASRTTYAAAVVRLLKEAHRG